ncbi:uncharacterized protein LOC122016969 [Zingiber officinale]|uniref:uncharacterized protein LOC122016969 n=1 Tax=Zingiber officinale TaxID=94328 RepID=UPI001C4A895E|nr:uncharacterized protein LOC122016969 [Zingiber officinale]XP_042430345.1 uncharacterized protein LOC122016969 [Zingiber officinale]
MAPAQCMYGANEEGKLDVSVKTENKEFVETKEAAGIFSSDNSEDRMLCVGSLKEMGKSVVVPDESKLNHIVKSVNMELVDDKDVLGFPHAKNCEEVDFCAGSSTSLTKVDNVIVEEIDIVNCTDDIDDKALEIDDLDATECSSSFGDTFSGSENELKQENGGMEVDSPLVPSNVDPAVFDLLNKDFRKKKVSAHWRKFISPLTWRCQWLELHMKQFFSQASMYDKELTMYKHGKELQSKIIELDNSVSRSVPFTSRNNWKSSMDRRKRKRTEDKDGISSYMSNHAIFSYYENKRTDSDSHSVDDDCEDYNIISNDDNEWLLGLKGGDNSLEQILLNIEAVKSRILKLKIQLDNVIGRDVREIPSPSNLSMEDLPVSFLQNGTGGGATSTGLPGTPPHIASECETQRVVMPLSEGSSYGDAADIGIIESTIGLLSGSAVTLDHHHMRDLCEDNEDVLIDNPIAEEEYQNFEKVSHETDKVEGIAKPNSVIHSGDQSTAPNVSVPETSRPGSNVEMPLQTILKPCYTGKRRGRKPKKKWQASLVAASRQPRTKKLRVSSSSWSDWNSGPPKTEKLQTSGPWRSERLKMQRLDANRKS